MKNLIKNLTGNFWSFRQFLSQMKARLLPETGTYPIKWPTGQRLQLLFSRFRVLIHEKIETFTKTAL